MHRATGTADLLVRGGRVATVARDLPWAEAVAVSAGRIVAVGADDDVRDLVGPRTEIVDLAGRLLIPAFQDAHVHPPSGGLDRLRLDLSQAEGLAAYRPIIRAYAEEHPNDPWILGGGWWSGAEGTPTARELDDLIPDRPAFLSDRNIHSAWANTRALELAGIDTSTPDPADGRIERNPDGSPRGVLIEGAMDLVARHAPPASTDLRMAGLLEAQRHLHSLGITAWQDAIVGEYATFRDSFDLYRTADERGDLSARVVGALWYRRDGGLDQLPFLRERRDRTGAVRAPEGRFRATSVKVMADGGCENHSAAMLEPYLRPDGSPSMERGVEFFDPDELRRAIVALDADGFQVHAHVLGDRACRSALDAFEAASVTNGPNDHRHHLAHVQVIHPDDLPRIGRLGLVATIQPLWAAHGPAMDELVVPYLGEPRASRQFQFASLARSGVRLAMGSDWPITTADPLWGIHVAVNRALPVGAGPGSSPHLREPFLPEEGLGLADALATATLGSAYVNHLDDETGSIEVGKLADLVVLDRDIFDGPAGEIADARVDLTLVGGNVVYERRS